MKKACALATVAAAWILNLPSSVTAEEIRDYYAEPGIQPVGKPDDQGFGDTIDPFSGTLQLNYTDIVVPGPGGLDVVVNRSYVSPKGDAGIHRGFGIGWTLHFGRLVVPTAHAAKICSQASWDVTTADNPSIELQDGSRELLVLDNSVAPAYRLITKSHWVAECPATATEGMRVRSPDGRTFEMNVRDTSSGETTWYVSTITDLDGNQISIDYGTNPTGIRYVQSVFRSDQPGIPLLTFEYLDQATSNIRLASITVKGGAAGDQVWSYGYVASGVAGKFQLTAVTRPDGKQWSYEYHPLTAPPHESLALRRLIHPHGGVIEYGYDKVFFGQLSQPETPVVISKTTSGPGVVAGAWTYAYAPGGASIGALVIDRTTVTTPASRIEYDYYGYKGLAGTIDSRWLIGLPIEQRTYAPTGTTPIEAVQHQWDSRTISEENYWHGRGATERDNQVFAPRKVQTSTCRGTCFHVINLAFDTFGNPTSVRETTDTTLNLPGTSNLVVPGERTRTISYYNDTTAGKWVIGKLDQETTTWVRDKGTGPAAETTIVDHQYLSNARLSWSEQDGVRTTYTYHPNGDIATRADAARFITQYQNYHRGIPRLEIHPIAATGSPVSFSIARTVNDTGTVASLTDGRGFTKTFTYDGLNRIQQIQYPKPGSASVTVNRAFPTKRELTRGTFRQTDFLDGFGRILSVVREDTTDGTRLVTRNYEYDALGRLVFESHPDPTTAGDGERWVLDPIGRKTRATHADGSYRTWNYTSPTWVMTTDERGFTTEAVSVAYGHPDDVLSIINVDEQKTSSGTIRTTQTWPNLRGQPIRILQLTDPDSSGPVRTFQYNTKYFLVKETHPDFSPGVIDYVRDANGNILERWWNGLSTGKRTAMTYDRQNRIKTITYATGDSRAYTGTTDLAAFNVTYTYDLNGNVTKLEKGTGTREIEWNYVYDENGNLSSERLIVNAHTLGISTASAYSGTNANLKRNYAIAARNLQFDYSYDSLDHMLTMRYPSGLQVEYQPDALGRPLHIRDAATGTLYASGIRFTGAGALKQFTQGNGITTVHAHHPRRWISDIDATGAAGTVMGLSYTYDGTGNVDLVADSIGDFDIDAEYDGLGQLERTHGPWGIIDYRYGTSGEMLQQIGPRGSTKNFTYSNATRLSGVTKDGDVFGYARDAFGNYTTAHTFTRTGGATSSTSMALIRDINFDGASNLVFVGNSRRDGSTGSPFETPYVDVQYVYDGLNHRVLEVRRDTAQTSGYRYKYTAYGKGGQLMYEDVVENACPVTREYLRIGSVLIAQRENQPETDSDGDGRKNCAEKEAGLNPFQDDATVDSDGDGLSNLQEWQLGLNQRGIDTDGDGLTDGFELANAGAGFNPGIRDGELDVDGDTVPTTVELRLGTNPLAADTDADGIGDAYELMNQGLNATVADSLLDTDVDGALNNAEFAAGSWASRATSTPGTHPTTVGGIEWSGVTPPDCRPVNQAFGSRFAVSAWGQLARLSKGLCSGSSTVYVWLELRRADGSFVQVGEITNGTTTMTAEHDPLHAPAYLADGRLVLATGRRLYL
ncbi:MAG: DUF6531 domain-containing protein, partial [Gammaproteobacteria bacterium]